MSRPILACAVIVMATFPLVWGESSPLYELSRVLRVEGQIEAADGYDRAPWKHERPGSLAVPWNTETAIETSPTLLTVPAGKAFVVTSLVTTNGVARWGWVCFDGVQVWKAFMDPTESHAFQGWAPAPRGLVATAGQQVAISVGNAAGSSAEVSLVGYYVNI